LRYGIGKTITDVSCKYYIQSSIFENVMREHGGSGLSIAAGNGDDLSFAEAESPFYLGYDLFPLFSQKPEQRIFLRDPRAFDDNIGFDDAYLLMPSLLLFYSRIIQ